MQGLIGCGSLSENYVVPLYVAENCCMYVRWEGDNKKIGLDQND